MAVAWQHSLREDEGDVKVADKQTGLGLSPSHPHTADCTLTGNADGGGQLLRAGPQEWLRGTPASSPTLCSSAHSAILQAVSPPSLVPHALPGEPQVGRGGEQGVAEGADAKRPARSAGMVGPGSEEEGRRVAGLEAVCGLVGELVGVARALRDESAGLREGAAHVWQENQVLQRNLEEARVLHRNLVGSKRGSEAAGPGEQELLRVERDALRRQVGELAAALEEERQQHQQERLLWILHRSPDAGAQAERDRLSHQSSSYSLSASDTTTSATSTATTSATSG